MDLRTIGLVGCGLSVVCCGSLLMGFMFLGRFGRSALLFTGIGQLISLFFGKNANVDDNTITGTASSASGGRRLSANDLRARAQSLDFDSQVAQRSGLKSQSSGAPPLRPPSSDLGRERFGSQPPRGSKPGGRPRAPSRDDPLDNIFSNPRDPSVSSDSPSLRSQRRRKRESDDIIGFDEDSDGEVDF